MRSRAMKQLNERLRLVAPKDVVLLLIGESGTGKEVLARLAHDLSERRTGPFVPINCAAIPESLFESELFGHERGAFTGANERARGKIEAAGGGTLFLDELGEMPFAMQAKLLRFLENRRFMRVGGTTKIEADVRLICATLRPLEEDVRAGSFRGDLFYRIQGITLRVPPLRERGPDLLPMLHEFTAELSARHGTEPPHFPRAVVSTLLRYSWPGNVRELRNAIELLCLIRADQRVRMRDLPEPITRAMSTHDASMARDLRVSLDEPLATITQQVITAALQFEAGNRTRAAERLGISLRTLQRALASRRE
ncbi:MAG TPA: sigma-54 dependent transcriptional regulator [Pseudomonadota bacterium]|nr:sigma-54 dependent transcriptional regulator [Pseudomonadota bacterium]